MAAFITYLDDLVEDAWLGPLQQLTRFQSLDRNRAWLSSGQPLMAPDIEGFPFEKRMSLYALLERWICSQKGRVDHPPVQ